MLDALFASGRAVDIVLAFIVIEAALLIGYRSRTGRGLALGDVAGMLAAGLFLLLALRAALTGGGAAVIAGCLLAALAGHLFDLYRRWPKRKQ